MLNRSPRLRRTLLIALGISLMVSAGVAALPLFDLITREIVTDPVEEFRFNFDTESTTTGFTVRSVDGSPLRFAGTAEFDPIAGRQGDERVQGGFMLLDGTLSLTLNASKLDDPRARARTRTTYRFDVRRRALRTENIASRLLARRLVTDPRRATFRARHMDIRDVRVMRLVGREGFGRWTRAVRARRTLGRIVFRGRHAPTGKLGEFGFDRSVSGDPYVWAVMDRNSRYALGLTVDRDNDGVANASDNCVGTFNNQDNFDADAFGDACDLDDDNDAVQDTDDNCPLAANANQTDLDFDGAGDACDADDDNDLVIDAVDRCPATAPNSIVDATGCSIADACRCDSQWRNHGAYVKCVAQTSGLFAKAGLITSVQKDALVSAAAQSACGF